MAYRSTVNWDAVKADFLAGNLSVRQIGKKHGVDEKAIRKKAKEKGWERGSSGESPQQRPHPKKLPTVHVEPPRPIAAQGDFLDRARIEAETLLTELEETRRNLEIIEASIEEETRGDQSGRRRSLMLKAVSLPTRTMTFKTLTQALAAIADMSASKKGKKEERQEKAQEVHGRFSASAPPRLAIDNTKT